MEETPKKLVLGDLQCFLCSCTTTKKERIRVFGTTSLNIPSLIESAVDIDVHVFSSGNADLFLCRKKCYKRLIHFENIRKKLETIREDIKLDFREASTMRTKRLRRESTSEENMALIGESTENRKQLSAAKSLKFSSISREFGSTTCTSYNNDAIQPIVFTLPLIQQVRPYELVYNAFPFINKRPEVTSQFPRSPASPHVQQMNETRISSFESLPSMLTSTPVRANKRASRQETEAASARVRLSVEYPSKTVNKTLDQEYEALGKALVYGPPKRIANAVMKCTFIRKHVIENVLRVVSGEVSGLCSRKNPSILRKTGKADLVNYDMKSVCDEWRNKAPVFYSFLMTSCIAQSNNDATWLPSVALSGSILLKQRNAHMNATASVLSILLKTRSIEATLNRFCKLKLTCSNQCTLTKLDILGDDYDAQLHSIKARISKENCESKELQENIVGTVHNCSPGLCMGECCRSKQNTVEAKEMLKKQKESCHPGFTVPFDNIDLELQRKDMTMSNQNNVVHWVNHKLVENRVSGNSLPNQDQKEDILDVPNIRFFPNADDQRRQRFNYIVLVSRILVEYFDFFVPLQDACLQHVPHKYSKEMSHKSKKVPLGVIFKNENINEDMLNILKQFHSYLPKTADGGFDGQLFAGDQLTVERAVNVIASVANGYTSEARLEGINLQLGDWHAGVKILAQIFKRFFTGKSEGDNSTLYSDRTLINRRNVKGDPHSAYRADRDFFILVLKSRVITAAMNVLGFEERSGQPIKCPLPENLTTLSKLHKLQYLHKASALIVDEFVFQEDSISCMVNEVITAQEQQEVLHQQHLTLDGRFKCRLIGCNHSFKYDGRSRRTHELTHNPPPEIPDIPINPTSTKPPTSAKKQFEDDVFNYNCALLTDGLFFLNFLDAVSEGDGARIMRQYKYLLLYCRADGQHSTKYALESLYQSFLVNSLLSPRDSERFIWNRGVNTSGGKGKNIPLDLDVEHSNGFIKQAIKNLGPNVTEKAVARISHAESSTSLIIEHMDQSLQRVVGSGRHTHSSTERDLCELINRAVSTDVYGRHANRNYTHFNNFERDVFKKLDISSMYKWINSHKKNVVLGNRAR